MKVCAVFQRSNNTIVHSFFHFIKTKKLQTSSQGATDIHITYQYLKKSVEFLDSLGGTSFIK